MEDKLQKLYNQSIEELNTIGINISNAGNVDISISSRATKRYGCCKQEDPDKYLKTITKIGYKRVVRYEKFNKHHIEISKWVMNLTDKIIKNTIMHEIIHCFPYCNNHGAEFKKYANIINKQLGYNITRVGNKQLDYKKSNLEYTEKQINKYKIECQKCGQVFFRQRYNKNITKKYRCGICGGKFKVYNL